MKSFVVAGVALLAAGGALAQIAERFSPRVYEARVTRVSDGDTLWVQPLAGGRWRKLRIDGIDAPEICQDHGPAARDALSAWVLQRVVTVHERRYDDYGRALSELRLGGQDVAARLVGEGLAWSYRWRHSPGPYAAQETLAREARKGLFAAGPATEMPRDFRQRHGPCNPDGPVMDLHQRR